MFVVSADGCQAAAGCPREQEILHVRLCQCAHRHSKYNLSQYRNHLMQSQYKLTLTVLVATIDAQWEGMGDVGSARYEPALLPPCPTI